MLQACLNGARMRAEVAAVPLTPAELAAGAIAAHAAGAGELHVHPRDELGLETLEHTHIAAAVWAIRGAVPDMPVGVSTGAWIRPGGAARLEAIRSWTVLPDYASVNLGEGDAPDCIEILLSKASASRRGLRPDRTQNG